MSEFMFQDWSLNAHGSRSHTLIIAGPGKGRTSLIQRQMLELQDSIDVVFYINLHQLPHTEDLMLKFSEQHPTIMSPKNMVFLNDCPWGIAQTVYECILYEKIAAEIQKGRNVHVFMESDGYFKYFDFFRQHQCGLTLAAPCENSHSFDHYIFTKDVTPQDLKLDQKEARLMELGQRQLQPFDFVVYTPSAPSFAFTFLKASTTRQILGIPVCSAKLQTETQEETHFVQAHPQAQQRLEQILGHVAPIRCSL